MNTEFPLYDLHCHSTASDGALPPGILLERAIDKGIKVLSLTDHDTVAGVQDLLKIEQSDVNIIPGAEFTCAWNNRVLHIVGLNLDLNSTELSSYFAELSHLRIERAKKISAQMMKLGLPDLYESALSLADEGSIGRPHFALAMVKLGIVTNEQQAFKKYLGTGKKGDIKVEWPSLEKTVNTIKVANGLSVLAHPTKYKMTFTKLRTVIADFVEVGGDGIEISYPGITREHQSHLLRIADKHGMLISAGSDFHSPAHGWTELGKYPKVPRNENHVLSQIM